MNLHQHLETFRTAKMMDVRKFNDQDTLDERFLRDFLKRSPAAVRVIRHYCDSADYHQNLARMEKEMQAAEDIQNLVLEAARHF
jgi:hypothetical protein